MSTMDAGKQRDLGLEDFTTEGAEDTEKCGEERTKKDFQPVICTDEHRWKEEFRSQEEKSAELGTKTA